MTTGTRRRFREPPTRVDLEQFVESARDARDAARQAKAERARAMDSLVDLLLEWAEMRHLLRECLPYMWVAPAQSAGLADLARMPKDVARRIEEVLR